VLAWSAETCPKVWSTINYQKGYEKRFNQDYAWFRKGEADVRAADKAPRRQVPRDLVERRASTSSIPLGHHIAACRRRRAPS
jgi:hypothetical protein